MASIETQPSLSTPLTIDQDLDRIVDLLNILEGKDDSHLPKDKIALLRDIIKSPFFLSVKEVYKNVHSTVEDGGDEETRAAITAKATVAAFAASEGHAHPRLVELEKTEEGFGFNVMGGSEQKCPLYISRIIPNGYADRHGQLRRGDQLISVNGVNVENAKHEMAVDLLKTAVGKISLVVRYSPSVLEEMEKRFERTKSFHASRSRSSRQH